MIARLFAAALCAGLLFGLTSGCGQSGGSAAEGASADFYAMDTVMALTAYGAGADRALSEAESAVNRLEALLSRTRPDSEVSAINGGNGAPVSVSAETAALLNAAWSYSRATDGAFDITIAPVVSAWGFTADSFQVPGQAELDALLDQVDYQGVLVEGLSADSSRVTLRKDQSIDLGGVAKGYAADQVAAIFTAAGVDGGTAVLGGNVYVNGAKSNGAPWRVGVQDPADSNGFVGVLSLTDAFAVTSGGYQRYFEQDGKTYHHILNPKTGYPADSGLASVTVVAESGGETAGTPGRGTMCDALSTALYVMGEEKAVAFWRSGVCDFQLVLVTGDGRVLVTEGLADKFEQERDSGYAYETISQS